MLKIATHNSLTGEKPKNLLSWIMIPFSRTQSKTIRQQYEAGCRMFDLRCRFDRDGISLRGAHGLFVTDRQITDILEEIDSFPEPCYVSLTYEGVLDRNKEAMFKTAVGVYKAVHKRIKWGDIAAKYKDRKDIIVDWINICPAEQWDRTRQGFVPLNGKTWQTYLPIPWLWKKIYHDKPKFDEDVFTFVDFL